MNVTNRITNLLIANGVQPRQIRPTLARVCGISYAAVSQWFNGRTSSIKHENLLAIARAFNSTVDWLISGDGEMIAGPELELDGDRATPKGKNPITLTSIPLITWISAGLRSRSDTFIADPTEVMMPSPDKIGPRSFALVVEGDAMRNANPNEDSYPNNTIIFVDPDLNPVVGSPVLVAQKDKETPIFRIYTRDGGQDILKPLNPQFPIIDMKEGDEICGVVCGYYRRPRVA